MNFWKNVTAILQASGRSGRWLAAEIGVSSPTLTNYNQGGMPSLAVAARIAQTLNRSLDDLVWGTPDEVNPPACQAPHEHILLKELTEELGIQELRVLAKSSSMRTMLQVVDLLTSTYPEGLTRKQLADAIPNAPTDILNANILALQRNGTITGAESGAEQLLKMKDKSSASFVARRPGDFSVQTQRAMRLLLGDILPALERGPRDGHLITVKGTIPTDVAYELVAKMNAYVESECRTAIARDGDAELAVVFGVACKEQSG